MIELEVVSGKGGWEGSKGNLTGYTYKEAATPLAPEDLSGATPSFTVGVSEDDTIDGTFALLDSKVRLTDDLVGNTIGTVRTITSTNGGAGLEIESRLSVLNSIVALGPYNGTLSGAIAGYMAIAQIDPSEYTIDGAIATRPVTLPGWYGSMYDAIKQLCATNLIEVSQVSGRLFFRPVRLRNGSHDHDISAERTVNSTTIAKAIEIYYYNNTYRAVGSVYPVDPSEQNAITVKAGEVVTQKTTISAYLMNINQPIPAAYVPREITDASVYTVIDKDGKIVDPGLWTLAGGKITAALGNAADELVITISGAALETQSPFRIAMPEGKETYASLRISGEGVFYNKQKLTIPTGADPAKALTPVGVTVDNPFVNTLADACSFGTLTAKKYSGRDKAISFSSTSIADLGLTGQIALYTYDQFAADNPGLTYNDFQVQWAGKTYNDFSAFYRSKAVDQKLFQSFGNVIGARIPYKHSMYRVRDASYTQDSLQYNGESDTLWSDFTAKFAGVSYAQFQTANAGRTYYDHMLAPLYRAPILDTLQTNMAPSPYPAASNMGTNAPWSTGQAFAVAELVPNGAGMRDSMKVTRTSGTSAYAIRMGYNQLPIFNGTFTYQYKVKATGTLATGGQMYTRVRQGTSSANLNSRTITLTGDWQTITQTVTVDNVTQNLSVQLITNTVGAIGDSVEVADLVVYMDGQIPDVYVDGNTPGWRWFGTPGNSASSGFPYTLKSILPDAPYLEVEGVGTVSRADKLDTTQDRTLFSVWNFINQSVYATVASLANTANGNHNMKIYGHVSSNGVFTRVQTSATTSGVDYRDITVSGPRTNGRHVGIAWTSGNMATEGITATSATTGLALSGTAAIPVGAQHQANQMVAAASADHTPIYQVAYAGTVDPTVRTAVMRWLANKYVVRYTP